MPPTFLDMLPDPFVYDRFAERMREMVDALKAARIAQLRRNPRLRYRRILLAANRKYHRPFAI